MSARIEINLSLAAVQYFERAFVTEATKYAPSLPGEDFLSGHSCSRDRREAWNLLASVPEIEAPEKLTGMGLTYQLKF